VFGACSPGLLRVSGRAQDPGSGASIIWARAGSGVRSDPDASGSLSAGGRIRRVHNPGPRRIRLPERSGVRILIWDWMDCLD